MRTFLMLFFTTLTVLSGSYRFSNEGKVLSPIARPVSTIFIQQSTTIQVASDKPCRLTSSEVKSAIRNLESHKFLGEPVDSTKKMLLDKANESLICRNKIIPALMRAMDKPDLNGEDTDSFFIWVHGSELLGKLKASEAIDLLIDHMTFKWTYGFRSNYKPVLVGIQEMGTIALPKLTDVLQRDVEIDKRFWAIWCLGHIGGKEAVRSLSESLELQTDPAIKCAISTALDYFDSDGQLKRSFDWTGRVDKCYE